MNFYFNSEWLAALERASLDGGIALLLAFAICRAVPSLAPPWKCWLWRLAYLKVILSLFSAASVDLPLLSAPPQKTSASVPPVSELVISAVTAPQPASFPATFMTDVPAPSSPRAISRFLLWAWVAGTIVFLVRLAFAFKQAHHLRRHSKPCSDPDLSSLFASLCSRFGVRVPLLLISSTASEPLVTGAFRSFSPRCFPVFRKHLDWIVILKAEECELFCGNIWPVTGVPSEFRR